MFLNCHSYHSLRYGTLSVEKLVNGGKYFGAEAMALTDINCTTGVYDFIKCCHKAEIKPIVGVDFRNGNNQLYTALAKNQNGFREINEVQTTCNLNNEALPERAPEFEHVYVIYPFDKRPEQLLENEYVGVRMDEVNKLIRPGSRLQFEKLVVFHTVSFHSRAQYVLHTLLRGIHNNVILSRLTNEDVCRPEAHFVHVDDLLKPFEYFPQLIRNTERLIANCNFEFDFDTPKNKKTYTRSRYNDLLLLESLALEGMEKRYSKNNVDARARVKSELQVIHDLELSGYFLVTWDVIRYSLSRSFYHVGRGSGANSIVSYCLGITDICPLELNLFFERFLNPSRTSPPDFDIDWSWKNRDEILSYIFKRFDEQCTAFTGTIGTFKHRSIMRELGKVYGLPKNELDLLSTTSVEGHPCDSIITKIHKYGKMLEGNPNLRSLHSCGIIISEEPLTNYSILTMPPKGFQTVQFDMYIGEDIGFDKLDILSQRGLGHIKDSVELIRENLEEDINIHDINKFKRDPLLNEHLANGRTLGCFYIESPAMRGLLRRLKCEDYETLVAASSVIRPGVAKSGMMREYVFRHNHPDKFEYFHPVFEEHLGDTYGVMVYQEDVLKIAHFFAGLDLADADILRRAMSGKTRSKEEFNRVKEKFFKNCSDKNYPEKLTNEVYRQIESFAGYSFCKAHSASYAVESYQSLFLRTYYPIEFLVAVVNNFGGFYRTEVYVHELKMSGGIVEPPCVNQSDHLTTLSGKHVFLGFVHMDGLGQKLADIIVEERKKRGLFESLEDFVKRVPVGIERLQKLIFIGAFRFSGIPKNELILSARMLLGEYIPQTGVEELFKEPVKDFAIPELNRSKFEDAFDEIELLGFPVSYSPFDLLQTDFRGDIKVKHLLSNMYRIVRMVAYLISRKQVPTNRGTMYFGTWIDDEGLLFDTAHFPDSLDRYPFAGGGCYLLKGKVEVDYNFPTITIHQMKKLPFIPDPRFGDDDDSKYTVHENLKEDVSSTHRAPYPSEREIGLPRHKM